MKIDLSNHIKNRIQKTQFVQNNYDISIQKFNYCNFCLSEIVFAMRINYYEMRINYR